jgi:hypothetical protein
MPLKIPPLTGEAALGDDFWLSLEPGDGVPLEDAFDAVGVGFDV